MTTEDREAGSVKSESLLDRLHGALGPLAGGLILDFVDLAMFGPLGLVAGPIVGAAVGWWISSLYRFSVSGRVVFGALAALYVTLPFTEILPIATLISAVARFQSSENKLPEDPSIGAATSSEGSSEASVNEEPESD